MMSWKEKKDIITQVRKTSLFICQILSWDISVIAYLLTLLYFSLQLQSLDHWLWNTLDGEGPAIWSPYEDYYNMVLKKHPNKDILGAASATAAAMITCSSSVGMISHKDSPAICRWKNTLKRVLHRVKANESGLINATSTAPSDGRGCSSAGGVGGDPRYSQSLPRLKSLEQLAHP